MKVSKWKILRHIAYELAISFAFRPIHWVQDTSEILTIPAALPVALAQGT